MIIQNKLTKKEIISRIQGSSDSNCYFYEPITSSSLSDLLSLLRKLFTSKNYLSIVVIKSK